MDVVSAFPFLTKGDFFKACEHVQRVLPNSVLLLLADDSPCLRITRRFINEPVNPHADNNDDDDNNNNIHDRDEDDDQEEEAVVKAPQSEQHVVTVQYDVLLSPSYRVPVVYMMASPPLPLSHFVDLVVPHHFQDAVRATGVMGALSMTDHPDTGMPAYFVHPCRTADTMRDTGIANTSVQDYMLIWLGIVGASVGLNVSSTDLCRA